MDVDDWKHEELEAAFRVVQKAWDSANEEEFVQIRVPKSLQHLSKEDWEDVCQMLEFLQWQQSSSPIH